MPSPSGKHGSLSSQSNDTSWRAVAKPEAMRHKSQASVCVGGGDPFCPPTFQELGVRRFLKQKTKEDNECAITISCDTACMMNLQRGPEGQTTPAEYKLSCQLGRVRDE